jgi:hypothetical protein
VATLAAGTWLRVAITSPSAIMDVTMRLTTLSRNQ